MSGETVELVRACYEAFGRREYPEDQFDDTIEWTTDPAMPDAATYRGRDEVRRFFRDWIAGWAEIKNEPERFIDLGDRVVVLVRGVFRLTEDAMPLERDYAHLWTARAGRVVAVEAMDRDRALALARLRE